MDVLRKRYTWRLGLRLDGTIVGRSDLPDAAKRWPVMQVIRPSHFLTKEVPCVHSSSPVALSVRWDAPLLLRQHQKNRQRSRRRARKSTDNVVCPRPAPPSTTPYWWRPGKASTGTCKTWNVSTVRSRRSSALTHPRPTRCRYRMHFY